MVLVAVLAVLASSSVEGGHHHKHKTIIIHVPYVVNLKHHTHTITKHIIHKEHKEHIEEEPKKEEKPKKEEYHKFKGYSYGKHHSNSKKVEEKKDPHKFSTYNADFTNEFHDGLAHQITSYGNPNFKGHKETKFY